MQFFFVFAQDQVENTSKLLNPKQQVLQKSLSEHECSVDKLTSLVLGYPTWYQLEPSGKGALDMDHFLSHSNRGILLVSGQNERNIEQLELLYQLDNMSSLWMIQHSLCKSPNKILRKQWTIFYILFWKAAQRQAFARTQATKSTVLNHKEDLSSVYIDQCHVCLRNLTTIDG